MTIDEWKQDKSLSDHFVEEGLNGFFHLTEEQILGAMEPGVWYRFGEYDPYTKIIKLVNSGALEMDPKWNNRADGFHVSIRARKP